MEGRKTKDKHQVHFWTDAETAGELMRFADQSPYLGVTLTKLAETETGAVQLRYWTQGNTKTELNERMIGFFLSFSTRRQLDQLKKSTNS